uniref:Uncharacterized protein n=1 Tax=Anguilla anguilla TaxID=7936 RepID=A0A0E9PBN0_ANGAN
MEAHYKSGFIGGKQVVCMNLRLRV